MKKKPVISVVIPAFNEETLLPRALQALKHQDFREPFEVIVVDNSQLIKLPKSPKILGQK